MLQMVKMAVVGIVCVGLGCVSVAFGAAPGQALTLSYGLFVPAKVTKQKPAPLVVMLHGCSETGEEFAWGTRMNETADKNGFIVLYPVQGPGRNDFGCWNWFLPENQVSGKGEPQAIMAAVEKIKSSYDIDSKRIFVAGLSAGGGMAGILSRTYPDVFRAAAIHSGPSYVGVGTVAEGFVRMKGERSGVPTTNRAEKKQVRMVPLMIVQGTEDPVVSSKNVGFLLKDFFELSLREVALHSTDGWEVVQMTAEPLPGRLAYDLIDYVKDKRLMVRTMLVRGLGHAWGGGRKGVPFMDEKGPDVAARIWEFFEEVEK